MNPTEYWIYQQKVGNQSLLRVYLNRGNYYAEIDRSAHMIVGQCVACKDSTMKAWGYRIDLDQAIKIVPDFYVKFEKAKKELDEELKLEEEENAAWRHKMTREQAKEVQIKLQQLNRCDIFSIGIEQVNGDYVIKLVLSQPAPYGTPESLDHVPIVTQTLEDAATQY